MKNNDHEWVSVVRVNPDGTFLLSNGDSVSPDDYFESHNVPVGRRDSFAFIPRILARILRFLSAVLENFVVIVRWIFAGKINEE